MIRFTTFVLPAAASLFITHAALAGPTPQDAPEPPAVQSDTSAEHQYLTGDWFGLRRGLEDRGIEIGINGIADWSHNFRGGLDTERSVFRYLLDLGISIDTEALLKWKGGTFFILFQHTDGDLGEELAGDWQWTSWIDSEPRTQLSELWYEQWLLDERLRIKVGKIDANYEFGLAENLDGFIHGSLGYLTNPIMLPTYPDPATGFNIFAYPVEWFYAGFGLYDGALQEGVPTGKRGPSTFFGSPADLFLISEAGVRWGLSDDGRPGRLALGVWHHTGTFERFAGGTENGSTGWYVFLDQALWRENPGTEDDEQGINMFLHYGWSDPDITEIEHHIGGGLTWRGAIPGRDDDVIGLGASLVTFSDEPGADFDDDYELNIETFYKIQLTPYLGVTFDLQHISNPGGAGLRDALMGTLRLEVAF